MKIKSKKELSQRLLVGLTGWLDCHWQEKLREIESYGIDKISLFLERFEKNQRQQIYQALLNSQVKTIPLVHIRNDMDRSELAFLVDNFKAEYLTIHEDSFKILNKWTGFYSKLYLEMNTDNFVQAQVDVSKIGGFCIDLSHFKVEQQKWSQEFEYIIKRRKNEKYFGCNHLNGYSYQKNTDLHTITNLKEFDYLKTLPQFLFGQIIALETNNSIQEQLKFKNYLLDFLTKNEN